MLEGKIALVTGAGQGNGAAIARGLIAHGAKVVLTDINEATVRAVASDIERNGGECWAYQLDVTDSAGCLKLAETVAAECGQVDIRINNAGICPRNTIDSPDVQETWDAAMSVNVDGTLNVTLAFVSALRATQGVIINMASIASFVSTATSIAYSTSKAAIKMLTQNLAQELAKDGVRVNAIAPGSFVTAMTLATRTDPERRERFLTRIPMRRFGEPDELIGPVVFLASSMSSYVTGSTLVVDGGYLAV